VAATRYLIVNADDFGLSTDTNRGIIEARERGIVTSASLTVRYPAAAAAAEYSKQNPGFSLGLHVDLAEWEFRNGEWRCIYEVVPVNDAAAVTAEVQKQLATFRELVGSSPTHLDSHQHVHRDEPVRSVLAAVARELKIPLRNFNREVRFFGGFYGHMQKGYPFPEGISVENLLRILESLPSGITELVCHPGLDAALNSPYRSERLEEVKTLCDPRVSAALQTNGIKRISFSERPAAAD
jgi:chitin disaccharide deacetylase